MPKGIYQRGEYSKHKNSHGEFSEVFWSRVDKNGPVHPIYGSCWVWLGARLKGGLPYGQFRDEKCHRISYRLLIGEIPDGLQVLHRCDNPSCVNPKHLFVGTPQDNMDDKIAKGRQGDSGTKTPSNGSLNGNAKLSDAQVIEVRRLKAAGLTARQILVRVGADVSLCTIRRCLQGRSWKVVKAEETSSTLHCLFEGNT